MKQILQNLKNGVTEVVEVPCPSPGPGQLLIRTTRSLVSVGTERMLIDFGKAGLMAKALQQPDKVRMVLDKIKTDGLLPTVEAVRNKLDQSLPLGYCNVGLVIELQDPWLNGQGFKEGDRVASNGKHAEMVRVPLNLCAKVPDTVSDDEAAFTVVGAIALQGIRLTQPTLGEAVVVTGLGLIGLLTVQLLRANGCRVLGIDFDGRKLALARQFGAETLNLMGGEDPVAAAERFSRGRGVDAVIITATTKSSEPVSQATRMCRKRGRITLVGVTGLELSRADFYEKELSFQVSCSYGPGRYDPAYEDRGWDYPFGFVRWTEQRNFEAVLDMLASGRLDVNPLISHRFSLEQAEQAYAVVGGVEPSLGILLEYSAQDEKTDSDLLRRQVTLAPISAVPVDGAVPLAFIGAGNYATSILIPAFKAAGARLHTVASSAGLSGLRAGRKYGFSVTTTDTSEVLADPAVKAVVITTRHDSHACLVCDALRAGKHVFVEKPLCLTLDELALIESAYLTRCTQHSALPIVMVGFNRRFAPQVKKIKNLLGTVPGPKALVMTVNAGAIPADHWTQNRESCGGRIIGEVCHFIDLLRFLVGASITEHRLLAMQSLTNDTVTLQLVFADGSIGTIHYFANGSKSFPKERLEVFAAGRVLQLDNFRCLTGFGWPGFSKMKLWSQDKGQRACAQAFINVLQTGGQSPISLEEIMEVSRVTIEIANEKG